MLPTLMVTPKEATDIRKAAGEVFADGISLTKHRHTTPDGAQTSEANGGGG